MADDRAAGRLLADPRSGLVTRRRDADPHAARIHAAVGVRGSQANRVLAGAESPRVRRRRALIGLVAAIAVEVVLVPRWTGLHRFRDDLQRLARDQPPARAVGGEDRERGGLPRADDVERPAGGRRQAVVVGDARVDRIAATRGEPGDGPTSAGERLEDAVTIHVGLALRDPGPLARGRDGDGERPRRIAVLPEAEADPWRQGRAVNGEGAPLGAEPAEAVGRPHAERVHARVELEVLVGGAALRERLVVVVGAVAVEIPRVGDPVARALGPDAVEVAGGRLGGAVRDDGHRALGVGMRGGRTRDRSDEDQHSGSHGRSQPTRPASL